MKSIAKIIRQVNAAKFLVYTAKSALKEKENIPVRDRLLRRMRCPWVPGAIKEMNSKPPGLGEGGLFEPSLGVNSDVGR